MQSLLPDDLYWVRRRLPGPVVKLMKQHAGKAVIAGGYIRSCVSNELINDIDIFAPSVLEARQWARELVAAYNAKLGGAGSIKIHESKNAFTVIGIKPSVQIVHRWTYSKPEDIISSFDFTIARSAMWWEPGEVRLPPRPRRRRGQLSRAHRWRTLVDDRFYADLSARRLIYCSPIRNEDAGGSMLRVLKFYQRGFRIPLPSLAAVIARLGMAIDWEEFEPDPLNRQAAEQQAATALTGLLREVDPTVDPDHVMHLPTTGEQADDEAEGELDEAEGDEDEAA